MFGKRRVSFHRDLMQFTLNESRRLGTTKSVEINNKFHNPFIIGGPKRFYSSETVPYTKRTRFISLPTTFERNETQGFEEYKQRFEGRTMPQTYQESVRHTKILNNIIDALQRERKKMSPESNMSHLDGLNWEVVVVFLPYISGTCFANGKIGLSWDLVKPFPSDAEKATLIAREVAHVVARHFAEKITKSFWFYAIHRMLEIFVTIDFEKRLSPLIDRLPFNRR
ncbi:mitochondrial metalloendopeptidase OMA1 [Medicago truncatula]|uniref:mitochondrial metalloendopeptidase OMA1 n=1 Tax=Medicago truncatula TaxID=3880 RepID=UPI000D2F1CDA|nr:mitochondrial metalloendopeptidase OMA1 [Medicago truncatula]